MVRTSRADKDCSPLPAPSERDARFVDIFLSARMPTLGRSPKQNTTPIRHAPGLSQKVRTYLLLRSILWQLAAIAEGLRPDGDEDDVSGATAASTFTAGKTDGGSSKQWSGKETTGEVESWGPHDLLVAGLCTLRLLRANMYHLRAAGVSPGAVGLGTSSGPSSSVGGRRESGGADQRSPFASGLLSLLLDYAGGVLDVIPAGEQDEACSGGGEEGDMDALRRAVRYEAAEVVGQGLEVFLPETTQKVKLLSALLRLAGRGGGVGDGNVDDDENKDEERAEESKTWGGRSSSTASAAAAVAAMADRPLPVDMDDEGCAALLSGVCNAVCSDTNLLLSLVPEAVRPPLTVRDVPSYVAGKVRSAEKMQAQALQQRMLKEAASTAATATPSGSGGGGGSASARLSTSSRGRDAAGDDDSGGLGLWKTGRTARLPRAGDVVIRGPDWAWGGQDGDAGGRGLVVGLATWGRAVRLGDNIGRGSLDNARSDGSGGNGSGGGSGGGRCGDLRRNAVRVMWEKGAINVYRWGAPDSLDSDGKPHYDLKVLRPAAVAQGDPPRGEETMATSGGGGSDGPGSKGSGGGKSQGQAQGGGKSRAGRGELKWTAEEVEAALLPAKGGGEGPTAREVLRFMKNNAPQEWREPRRITGAENALVKVT